MSGALPMTPSSLATLKAELDDLQHNQMPTIVEEISVAREKGDLKENAEYHAAKDKQGLINAKIKYLRDHIGRAQVIDPTRLGGDRVVFGAIVRVFDLETGEETTYQIVGEDEADYNVGKISIVSPLARALLGSEEGDEVKVVAPQGVRALEIAEVRFPTK